MSIRRHGIMAWLSVAGLLLPATRSSAQSIRGIVRDSSQAAPLSGAIVTAVDSLGRSGSRTITDIAGRFSIAAAGIASVHVIRIGYQPRDVAVPRGASVPDVVVSMTRLAPMLEAVRVSDRELCPGSNDRGPAFELWERARTALLSTVVAREELSATAANIVYRRAMAPSDGLVRGQTSTQHRGSVKQPFVASAKPETFAQRGYMSEDAAGRVFYAPDADVLLDPSFAATHCFRRERADVSHPGQAGLGFAPIEGRDSLVEVRGVIWMDQVSSSLASLEFQFVNLEPATMRRNDIGGHIEFQTAANGVLFIDRWSIRSAALRQTRAARPGPAEEMPARRQARVNLEVAELSESGGQALSVSWSDGTAWTAPRTAVSGTITDRATHAPMAGALVVVDGTADTAVADASGRFALSPIIPGRYALTAVDTTFAAFTRNRQENRTVAVGPDSVVVVPFVLPPFAEVISQICKTRFDADRETIVTGKIVWPGGALRDAEVRARWQYDISQSAAGISAKSGERFSSVDDRGQFIVCGVARDGRVNLHLASAQRSADTSFVVSSGPRSVVVWNIATAVARTSNGSIGGIVFREGNVPIADAEISISSVRRSVKSDSLGRFEIPNIAPGMYALQVRHVGDAATIDTLTVAGGETVRRTIVLSRAVRLDTVRTQAGQKRYISPMLTGVEERRKLGFGAFLTDSMLRASDDRPLTNLITSHVPGTSIARVGGGEYLQTQRAGTKHLVEVNGKKVSSCFANVYLDGVMIYEFPNPEPPDLRRFSTDQLAAVEFYAGGATTPVQFKQGDCGTLLLWTRER